MLFRNLHAACNYRFRFMFCFVSIVCLSSEGVTSRRVLAYDLMILLDDGSKTDCHQTSNTLQSRPLLHLLSRLSNNGLS